MYYRNFCPINHSEHNLHLFLVLTLHQHVGRTVDGWYGNSCCHLGDLTSVTLLLFNMAGSLFSLFFHGHSKHLNHIKLWVNFTFALFKSHEISQLIFWLRRAYLYYKQQLIGQKFWWWNSTCNMR